MSKSHRNCYYARNDLYLGFQTRGRPEAFQGKTRAWFKHRYAKGRRRAEHQLIDREIEEYYDG